MAGATLRGLVGQVLTVGLPGTTLDAPTRQILEAIAPGCIILFRRNVGTPDAVAELCAALHALPSQPLVSIDHEGGRVQRLGAPFTHFPPAAKVGACDDPEQAFQVGLAMGRELTSVGIDLSYAPVLDVYSNPQNPVIGDRSYSADPETVSRFALAMANGLEAGGVLVCGKHFPGHGDTATDSHLELPTVGRSRDELERTELVPFRAAIAAGIPMLMSAHVVFTALDVQRPATLSPLILTALLRRDLGFYGVIATDDMEMRAIAAHQSIGSAAVQALAAGADCVLVCNDLDKAVETAETIKRAVRRGELPRQRLADAAKRVQALHQRRGPRMGTTCLLPNAAHQALAARLSG